MAHAFTLLPNPRKITLLEGTYAFQPDRLIQIDSAEPHSLLFTAGKFQKALKAELGLDWQAAAGWAMPKDSVGLSMSVLPHLVGHPQGYRLEITPQGINLRGHDAAGVFYGVDTLNQLLSQAKEHGLPAW
jgi:hexosaminidase